jgi:hypothetical protein
LSSAVRGLRVAQTNFSNCRTFRFYSQLHDYITWNRHPPAWKSPPHLHNSSKHNIYSRLMQAHLGHAHIGEYYRDFNIPEDTSCPCGTDLQTHIHILSECPLFDDHRHLLHNDKQNIISTNLFGTKEGIERFTTKMNAFACHCKDYLIGKCFWNVNGSVRRWRRR